MRDDRYTKVVRDNIAYYIKTDYIHKAVESIHCGSYVLTQYANFAIDLNTNEFIKCRWMLEDIMDNFLNGVK